LHFAVLAITLLKVLTGGSRSGAIIVGAVIYVLFAAWFGLVLITHPLRSA
jgi:hypothetical protein